MKHTKVRRVGSGRTKGSFSFVPVTLGQLKAKFNDDNMKFLLSRKQAALFGFENLVTGTVGELTQSIAGQVEESAAKVNITEL